MLRVAASRIGVGRRWLRWARRSVCIAHHGCEPRVGAAAFCASTASVVGDVELKEDASVWYGCVLRGDGAPIVIGERSNVQDGTVVHVDSDALGSRGAHPTIVGADVTVGHMALLHACDLRDRSFVGMHATVMEEDSMLAAGSLLTGGKVVGSGELWGGVPAKFLRHLKPGEVDFIKKSAAAYVGFARSHRGA